MKQRLTTRLEALRHEYETGQQMLADLADQQNNLHQTMLRISGAIQVLEELLHDESSPATNGVAPVADVERTAV